MFSKIGAVVGLVVIVAGTFVLAAFPPEPKARPAPVPSPSVTVDVNRAAKGDFNHWEKKYSCFPQHDCEIV